MNKHMCRTIAIAIAACLFISSVCLAVGQIAYTTGTSGKRIERYAEAASALKKLDAGCSVPERFENGYRFAECDDGTTTACDENNNALLETASLMFLYTREGAPDISLHVEPSIFDDAAQNMKEMRVIGGAKVYFSESTYKFVPPEYVLTDEDKANLERPDYQISYGSEDVEIKSVQFCDWEKDGIRYTLLGSDTRMEAEEWFEMAKEVIG